MFLNKDSIQKRLLCFEQHTTYFEDDAKRIAFEDCTAYFHEEVRQVTNGVYEGTSLKLTLYLKDSPQPYALEIDSNKQEKYKTVYQISHAIAAYRTKALLEKIQEQQTVVFETLNGLVFTYANGVVRFCVKSGPEHEDFYEAQTIRLQKNSLVCQSKGKRASVLLQRVSDGVLFVHLVASLPCFKDESHAKIRRERWLYAIFMGLLVLFGLNGFFAFCCMEAGIIKGISELCRVLLGVVLLVSPAYWLVGKSNEKKMKKEHDALCEGL